jgi:hypothetical protein
MKKGHWPDEAEIEKVFNIYRRSEKGGLIEHTYATGNVKIGAEALAKAAMAILEAEIAIAVDIYNRILFIHSSVLKGVIEFGQEKNFKQGFKTFFYALKKNGVKSNLIKIKNNGSIKFID